MGAQDSNSKLTSPQLLAHVNAKNEDRAPNTILLDKESFNN